MGSCVQCALFEHRLNQILGWDLDIVLVNIMPIWMNIYMVHSLFLVVEIAVLF